MPGICTTRSLAERIGATSESFPAAAVDSVLCRGLQSFLGGLKTLQFKELTLNPYPHSERRNPQLFHL